MGSRYEGEKAISLEKPLSLKLPFSLPKRFFQGSGGPHGTQARLLLTVSDDSSRRPARPDLSPQSPSRGMACRMRLAHGRTTPTAAPGPLLVPLPFLPWP